ncbi:hypothetical protein LWF01_02730 [Saxibacter everestensis]|uniref:Uncharacterized protein n=1 Tax=Saxibacter everestensis TaxID=2909229 RepID=A0ABY8QUP4_9MICO|nr:hypothetical protein LWF01_02730 [Brevibacteriaceae bacterium ZFBP1038]
MKPPYSICDLVELRAEPEGTEVDAHMDANRPAYTTRMRKVGPDTWRVAWASDSLTYDTAELLALFPGVTVVHHPKAVA